MCMKLQDKANQRQPHQALVCRDSRGTNSNHLLGICCTSKLFSLSLSLSLTMALLVFPSMMISISLFLLLLTFCQGSCSFPISNLYLSMCSLSHIICWKNDYRASIIVKFMYLCTLLYEFSPHNIFLVLKMN